MSTLSPSSRTSVGLAVLVLLMAVAGTARAQDPAGQTVARLENAWAAAELKHDAVTIGKLLSEDFTFVSPNGALETKAQLLRRIATDTTIVVSGGNSELQPRVHGNTVVITGLFTVTVRTEAGNEQRRYRWTDTWIKDTDGQWLCIAGQSVLVPKQ